jgi:uncharacterized cupin superfamily protein
MLRIIVETPDADRLARLGVDRWPVWEKEVSEFPWEYADTETSYILEGRVIVTPAGGAPVEIAKGDLATFPAGMACTWKVVAPLRKRYRFG